MAFGRLGALGGGFGRGGLLGGATNNAIGVFVFAGQSNSVGAGSTGTPTHFGVLDTNIKWWNGSAWATYDPATVGPGGHWGPEALFAYSWRQDNPTKTFYMVKSDTVATALAAGLTTPDWSPSGTLYPALKTLVLNATANLVSAFPTQPVVVRVLNWMQGESDAADSSAASAYQTNLATFIANARTDFVAASMKFVIGRILIPAATFVATVKAKQLAEANADGNATIVSTSTFTIPDGTHYDSASLETLGTRFYQSYVGTLNQNPTDIAIAFDATNAPSGVVPKSVTVGSTIGTLSGSNAICGGAALTFSEVSDADSAITVSGTNLLLSRDLTGDATSSTHAFTLRTTNDLGLTFDKAFSFSVGAGVAPTISSVVVSSGGADNTYIAGDVVPVTVNYSAIVNVTGTPQETIIVGASNKLANYVSGSGSTALVFNYTIAGGDTDTNGISVGSNALGLNGGTIKAADGTDASLLHSAVTDNAAAKVDTTAPTLSSTSPVDNATGVSISANLTATFSENIAFGGTVSITIKKTSDNSTVQAFTAADIGGALTISGATVTINPTSDLTALIEYYILITSGSITDIGGNAFAGISSTTAWSFTTASASTPAQWSASDLTAHVTISNVGKTVAYSGGGNNNISGRSDDASTASQLVYIEHTVVQASSSFGIGFSTTATTLSGALPGFGSTSTAWYITGTGVLFCADSANHAAGIIPSTVAGDTIDFAFNTSTKKGWARKNNGSWNVTLGGAQDPAAGTGGFAIPFNGPYKSIYWFDGTNGDGISTIFADANWVRTQPSGYTGLAA